MEKKGSMKRRMSISMVVGLSFLLYMQIPVMGGGCMSCVRRRHVPDNRLSISPSLVFEVNDPFAAIPMPALAHQLLNTAYANADTALAAAVRGNVVGADINAAGFARFIHLIAQTSRGSK